MEVDPILAEVHAMKDELAREVNYDIRALCERIRQQDRLHTERLAKLEPAPRPEGAESQ